MSQLNQALAAQVQTARQFFLRTISPLLECDSEFKPREGMFTAAQQVAHVAQTADWFLDGAFGGKGFDMNFAHMEAQIRTCVSLNEARQWLDRSFQRFAEVIASKSPAELEELFPEGSLIGGPKLVIVSCLADHTAHHRGALSVYARLLGKVSPMPYADSEDCPKS